MLSAHLSQAAVRGLTNAHKRHGCTNTLTSHTLTQVTHSHKSHTHTSHTLTQVPHSHTSHTHTRHTLPTLTQLTHSHKSHTHTSHKDADSFVFAHRCGLTHAHTHIHTLRTGTICPALFCPDLSVILTDM